MAHSPEFEEFLSGLNTPVTLSRDSMDEIPHIGALYDLVGDERVEAEDILIAALATHDGRVATALADAGCVRAIPALVQATSDTAPPIMRVFAARALLRLGDHSGRDALVRMIRDHDGSATDRGSAARLLAEFPDPDRELLIRAASTDPATIVRSQAIDALFTVVGLDDDDTTRSDMTLALSGRLLSPLSTVRDEAVAELRAILARIDAGETAETVGLTWRADESNEPLRRFLDTVDTMDSAEDDYQEDYAVEGLQELSGLERTYVENLILIRLPMERRAVRAAGRLGVRRAVEPLRELLRKTRGDGRREIQSAVDSITG
jgi:HEAT repeat protein